MKKSFLYFLTLGLVIGSGSILAQYDDVYYGASSARSRSKSASTANYSSNIQDDQYQDEEAYDDYDDESYNYLDEYDYNYTHRIRRFHRPLAGRSFYDPFYWDPWYFDPYYYSRGFGFITPRLGIGFYSFNDFNRWNRWQRYNSFRYWDPWTYSYWSYDPFLFNRSNNFFWASNAWCPTSWYSNRYYNNNNYWGNSYNGSYQPRYYTDNNVHFGPRRYGATVTSDRGPSRVSSRVISEPNGNTPDVRSTRFTPRDGETTVVRERNVPITRTPAESGIINERVTPRDFNNTQNESSRVKTESSERTRTLNNNNPEAGNTTRNSPRVYDNSNQERMRSQEGLRRNETPNTSSPSPRRNNDFENPRIESSPRTNEFRQQPRTESPRFEAPRQESPRRQNEGASSFRSDPGSSRSNDNNFRSSDRARNNDGFSGSSRNFGSSPSHNNNSGSSGSSHQSAPRTSPRNN